MGKPECRSYNCNFEDLKKEWQTLKEYRGTGYMWFSGTTMPVVLSEQPLPELPALHNEAGFPWEAYLYFKEQQVSVAIIFTTGTWVFTKVEWNGLPEDATGDYIKHTYITKKIPGKKKLFFKEYWQPAKDEECEGFVVLRPTWNAFVGFSE